jgi:dipeptidyl aminopeptidase/acylaminoacyl peptidase
MFRRFAVGLLLVSVCAAAQSAGKRPFTFEDMMALKRVAEPAVSPGGKWIAFSAVEVNLENNTRRSHLWVVPLGGGEARQISNREPGEERPQWSPDGRQLLFVSERDGVPQIWIADFDAHAGSLGEARKLSGISTGASGELWSPDGKNILFTSEVWPDCKDDECNRQRDEDLAKSKVKASIFTHLLYRHWSSYNTGKRTHIFVMPAAGGTALDLTPGDHDAPPFSLGGQDMYAFSPDGREMAYTSNVDEVEATSTNNEIFIVSVAGGTPKKISVSLGSDSTPLYSPDGRWIAWRMQVRAGYESDRFRLVIYDRQNGQIRNLTENFDRWVGTVAWAPDSKGLYFTAEDKGDTPIFYVSAAGNDVVRVVDGSNDDLALTGDGRTLVFTHMSIQSPNEIYSAMAGHSPAPLRQVTHLNDAVLSPIAMQPMEAFWFTGAEKAKVEGFLLKPPAFDPQKKYPVKFLIHGGPQGAWGDDWSFRWNPELFAANGYVVVMINPRGSTGYGQKFIDDINGDWGGRAYRDLMLGLDYVERTYSFADKDRECALGASYGGYMANWIEGNTTRFKCIVSHDGMFNSESAYGTTEELWFNEWEFKGTPWTNRELYRKWSPHLKAANFKTPMLVVHGQLDYRLDVSEGFQLYTTLQRLKVPSKMLYFPDEGHWVLKPRNSQLWYKTVNDWVDQWTR